ncbi:MAG TPA: potassium transporter Kup [Vicinamibacteria bacterium]|nr:potassium transporter Kup [Vicinamibacteria bacterium]
MSLAALGVVYGDIGTSPLYAIRECFHGEYAVSPTPANVLGVLSLIFWSLVLIVSVKYLLFVMRADNRGEGGVIALTALVSHPAGISRGPSLIFVGLGLFAASLLYGDGMITPAISVLSAVEGLRNITAAFEPYVVPLTIAILVSLFLLQRFGTQRVGVAFGPITVSWLLVIAVLGISRLAIRPQVLVALNPLHGVEFLAANRHTGFLVLGAVFLVVTGTEALYADMGHFGRRPIRLAWFTLVFPALLANYFGQGALLLDHPEEAAHPFYGLAPAWALVPLVGLATLATVIASQAVISGAFSLTRQAIQLGYLPRLQIVHTSPTEIGQIYIPEVNYALMVTTIGLVAGFRSSSQLAAAYGVAVTTTMLITSILFFVLARRVWKWGLLAVGVLVGLFLVVDFAFFAANIAKIAHGAWFPLVIGGISFALMTTWKKGRAILYEKLYANNPSIAEFVRDLESRNIDRVDGKAVFMAGGLDTVPPALLHNLKHNKVLHREIAFMTIVTEEVPRVPRDEKVEVEHLGQGLHRLIAHYGFMEGPNVPHALALAREKGLDFELEDVSFFLGREQLRPDRRPALSLWREKLFATMSRNAQGATTYFHIPAEQVIELGVQVEI